MKGIFKKKTRINILRKTEQPKEEQMHVEILKFLL